MGLHMCIPNLLMGQDDPSHIFKSLYAYHVLVAPVVCQASSIAAVSCASLI